MLLILSDKFIRNYFNNIDKFFLVSFSLELQKLWFTYFFFYKRIITITRFYWINKIFFPNCYFVKFMFLNLILIAMIVIFFWKEKFWIFVLDVKESCYTMSTHFFCELSNQYGMQKSYIFLDLKILKHH